MSRFLVYTFAVTLAWASLSCDGSKKKKQSSAKPPPDPAMMLTFYKGDAGKGNFIDPSALDETFKVLSTAKPGRVAKLGYTRMANIEQGSVWDQLSKIRAPSYASALGMLGSLGADWPVLISVSLVDGYLKGQNDLWYAGLEQALDKRLPDPKLDFGRGKISELLISELNSAQLATPSLREALTKHREAVTASESQLEELWKSDPFQFKPLSFYADDAQMRRLWTTDRYLLKNLVEPANEIELFNNWWRSSSSPGKSALTAMRAIFAKVTNGPDPSIFGDGGFAELVNPQRRAYQCDSMPCGSFWPPSSPGILERLPAGERERYDAEARAQPPMDEIVKAIKGGSLTLKPSPQDGFFIYQRFALEPLLRREGLAESQLLTLDEKMQDLWTEVYKAGTAKALETHQKVIDIGGSKKASAGLSYGYERLLLEPLPTAYKRYAQGYGMLLSYIKSLPQEFVTLWTVQGKPITEFIAHLESQTLGLYLVSIRQLGLNIDPDIQGPIDALGETALLDKARDFLANLRDDPTMAADQRFAAVQGRPGGPKDKACHGKPAVFWTTVGIEAVPVQVSGQIQMEREKTTAPNDGFVSFDTKRVFTQNMVVLVDHFKEIEACVDSPPNRREWRSLLQRSQDLSEAVASFKREF